jgi:hypothetical protein
MEESMDPKQLSTLIASCQCGAVTLEASGAPIVGAACYCTSCHEAGRRIELLPGAPSVLDADGGTAFILYRKDHVRCVTGGTRLDEHRLEPDATTRRMVANCCNSAMFLDVTEGHWLSLYRNRLGNDAPPLQIRTMTRDRRPGVELPADLPNYATHSGWFMWKLLAAWIAMGLRRPKVKGVPA